MKKPARGRTRKTTVGEGAKGQDWLLGGGNGREGARIARQDARWLSIRRAKENESPAEKGWTEKRGGSLPGKKKPACPEGLERGEQKNSSTLSPEGETKRGPFCS